MQICSLLKELNIKVKSVPTIWCDDKVVKSLSQNAVFDGGSKHVEIDVHFMRKRIDIEQLQVKRIGTNELITNTMTKALLVQTFLYFRNKLNVRIVELEAGVEMKTYKVVKVSYVDMFV